jgi:hypothetical protein
LIDPGIEKNAGITSRTEPIRRHADEIDSSSWKHEKVDPPRTAKENSFKPCRIKAASLNVGLIPKLGAGG